jgi:hypothetical protein
MPFLFRGFSLDIAGKIMYLKLKKILINLNKINITYQTSKTIAIVF